MTKKKVPALHDDTVIVQAAARGRPIKEIAATHGLTEEKVRTILDASGSQWQTAPALRRELGLEIERLNSLEQTFYSKAMNASDPECVASGNLYVKLAERKATLLGLNAPVHSAVQIIHHKAAETTDSIDRIREAIDRIRNPSLPKPDDYEQ